MAFLKFKANKYHVAHPNVRQHINKFFHELRVGDIDKSKNFECEIVKGSRAKHQIHFLSPKDPTLCQYHQLSYFCESCMGIYPKTHCVNKDHVLEWILTCLRLENSCEVQEIMYDPNEEMEASIGGEWIVDNLHPSDNVVILITTNEPFWLMPVEIDVHVVDNSFTDFDGNDGHKVTWLLKAIGMNDYK